MASTLSAASLISAIPAQAAGQNVFPAMPRPDSCSAAIYLRGIHHSITSSARARSAGGTVSPSVFAALRLIARLTANWLTALAIVASRTIIARLTYGAISLNKSSHLALVLNSNVVKPVTLPPGCAILFHETGADWISDVREH